MTSHTIKIEHEYTQDIVCPHCGFVFNDNHEFDPDIGEVDCPECGKWLEWKRHISITYSTCKMK